MTHASRARDKADIINPKQCVAASGSHTINAADDVAIALGIFRMPNQVAIITQIKAEFSIRRYLKRGLFCEIETKIYRLQENIPYISVSLLEEIAEFNVKVEACIVEGRKSKHRKERQVGIQLIGNLGQSGINCFE